jgi:hypothetical protein
MLRRIFKVLWPETVRNEQMAQEKPIIQQIEDRAQLQGGKFSIGALRDGAGEEGVRGHGGEG